MQSGRAESCQKRAITAEYHFIQIGTLVGGPEESSYAAVIGVVRNIERDMLCHVHPRDDRNALWGSFGFLVLPDDSLIY